MTNTNRENLVEVMESLIRIGFCQPKYYKPTVWKYAKKIMEIACEKGFAMPYDYGRGKGKYTGVGLSSSDIAFELWDDVEALQVTEKFMKYQEKAGR